MNERYRATPISRSFRCIAVAAACLLAGCGGGGGGSIGGPGGGQGSGWTPGRFLDASTFANQCAAPRSGTNPATGNPYPDRQGTVTDENNFLRSYSNDTYLWYDEITDRDPGLYDDPLEYFDLLKTTATTPSGADKDRFHFTYPSDEWYELTQSGESVGYGAQWALLSSRPPREAVVAYVDEGTPAYVAGLVRGTEILEVDFEPVVDGDPAILNAGLFPANEGEPHEFVVLDPNGTERTISMTSEQITLDPVQNVKVIPTPTGNVGYFQFNDHILTAEQQLIDAVNQLVTENLTDLIVDLRYNGGGYLFIASEIAFMIAGEQATAGRTFETLTFNDKHPSTNPVTGEPLSPTPFYSRDSDNNLLPQLNLNRVFVLTGPGTCSASESIMNSLNGIDIDVIQIGSRTCGKPYGFYETPNCGTSYFTIQFRGENDKGFGEYADGFSPQNSSIQTTTLPGCQVGDDFTRELGDPLEARFAAALDYRDGMGCPAPTGVRLPGVSKPAPIADSELVIPRNPARENRLLRQ